MTGSALVPVAAAVAQPPSGGAHLGPGGRRPAGLAMQPMRWWHLESVAALEARIFEDSPWSLEQFYAELAAQGRWLQVVVGEADVLGYIDVAVAGADADLMTIAVAPDVRGRGVGRWLLRGAICAAGAAGARTMFLDVRSDNPAAELYSREGFERLDVRRDYYAPGVDAVVMRRRLAGATSASDLLAAWENRVAP